MKKFISTVIKSIDKTENLKAENTTALLNCKRYDLFSGRINYLEYVLNKNNIKYKKKCYSNEHSLEFSYQFAFENKSMNFIIQWEKGKA